MDWGKAAICQPDISQVGGFTGLRQIAQAARERLILHYAPLVKYVASRVATGLPASVEQADLVSYGMFGLIDAIDKLEKETGPGPGLGPLQSLRAWLHKRRHAAEQNLEKSAASDAMRGLLELRPAFAGLAVYPDDFRSLAKGLRRCYRTTRESFHHAFAAERDETAGQHDGENSSFCDHFLLLLG